MASTNDLGLKVPAAESGPPVPRGRIGIWLLLGAETMFFVGILGAYVVVRKHSGEWPPRYEYVVEGLVRPDGFPVMTTFRPPALDLKLPLLNAVALTFATIAAFFARRAALKGSPAATRRNLSIVAAFGLVFVAGVVGEFVFEAKRGLTVHAGQYGSMVFFIIGAHAAHVVAGLIWHAAVLAPALRGARGERFAERVEYVGVYWAFVTILWWILLGILAA